MDFWNLNWMGFANSSPIRFYPILISCGKVHVSSSVDFTTVSTAVAVFGYVKMEIKKILFNVYLFCFLFHRHITTVLWGSGQTKLFPVCKPWWPGEAGQVGGEWSILGRGHLCTPQEHLDFWLQLTGVPCQVWIFPAHDAASTPPAEIQTYWQFSQGHTVQTDRSASFTRLPITCEFPHCGTNKGLLNFLIRILLQVPVLRLHHNLSVSGDMSPASVRALRPAVTLGLKPASASQSETFDLDLPYFDNTCTSLEPQCYRKEFP